MVADLYLQLRGRTEAALSALLKLASEMQREPAMLDTLQNMLKDVREPLLFVVVGEVKAGKSSLLNALFGQEFCKVDVLPATDRVYIFKHGPREQTVDVSAQVTERYQPIAFLKDFNIVDTPGTNTMVAEHQAITENFIPRADLVLFVFSVVNPWGASAWELLRFVNQKWLKNIIFVLQQADLRDPAEIKVIEQHLRETANQKLGFAPPIFAVSARKAFLSRTTGIDKEGLWKESEFAALEKHINLMVDQSRHGLPKLMTACQTATVILSDSAKRVRNILETIVRDEEQLTRLEGILASRKEQTLRQVGGFLRGIEQACARCEAEGQALLERNLSFWRTWRLVFGKSEWQEKFQSDLEAKMKDLIQPQIENALQLLETDLRSLWPQLQDTMENQFKGDSRLQLNQTIPDFARQRRELLQSIELTLVERIAGRGMEAQLERMFRETATWMRVPAGVAAAGGIVTVIAAMSSAAVADVTGIVAASAFVAGTLVAFGRRRKILAEYHRQMALKREELVAAIDQQLQHAIDLFYAEIGGVFQPLRAFCAAERKRYDPILSRVREVEKTFAELMSELARNK
ncbi:MAG: dynamin family protein [Verrucomicrobiota bacterium]|nr:dynamin family protein [Chthoniobacterales bacterium]MDQ3545480.1 dynamin family protein [Verrucomicrobiota bacterium]